MSPFDGDVDWWVTIDDGANSYKGDMLNIPDNMAILCLPPYSLELNPASMFLWPWCME